jgi:hypothetical protein
MKAIGKGLIFDTVIQGSALVAFAVMGLAALFGQTAGPIALAMILFFFFGVWQLVSGVVWTALLKDSAHRNYLLLALSYVVILFVSAYLKFQLGGGEHPFFWISIFVIPSLIAVWYFIITVKSMVKVQNRPRSFWDL